MFITILVCWLLIVSLFGLLWRIESNNRFIITPLLFIGYFEFLRVLPAFSFGQVYGYTDSVLPFLVAASAALAIFAGYGVMTLLKSPFSSSFSIDKEQLKRSLRDDDKFFLFLSVVLALIGIFYYRGIPPATQVALQIIAGGNVSELIAFVGDQRELLTKSAYFGGNYRGQGIFTSTLQIGWTLVLSYAAVRATIKRRKVVPWIVVSIVVVLTWVFVGGTGTRGPFLQSLLITAAAISLVRPLAFRHVLFSAFFIILLAVLISLTSPKLGNTVTEADWSSVQFGIEKIWNRIIFGNAVNDIRVIELVNSGAWDLRLGGNNLRNAITAIPGVQFGVPLPYELFLYLNPNSARTTFLSHTYIGHVYIDFHWLGVIVIFFLLGFVTAYLTRIMFRSRPTVKNVSFIATLFFILAMMVSSGPQGAIANAVVVAVFAMLYELWRRLRPTKSVVASARHRPKLYQPLDIQKK